MCNLYSTPYIPGCITLTEITTALEAGGEIIKLFPGSALSPSYVSAVKAPIPQVSVMVTGGVGLITFLNGSLLVQTPLELVANSINSLPKATLTASARLPNSMLHSDKMKWKRIRLTYPFKKIRRCLTFFGIFSILQFHLIHLDDEQISCSFLCGTDKPPQVARALDLPRLTDLLLYEGDFLIRMVLFFFRFSLSLNPWVCGWAALF